VADRRVCLASFGGNRVSLEFVNFNPTRSQVAHLVDSIVGMWGLRNMTGGMDKLNFIRDHECRLDPTVTEQNLFEIVKKIRTILAIEVTFTFENELIDERTWTSRVVKHINS